MTSDRQLNILTPDIPDGATFQVVGLGGVGSVVARYLAVFLAGVCASHNRRATLQLIDGDEWSPENANRVLFSRVGHKAEVLSDELLPFFADRALTIISVPQYLTAENVGRLLRSGTNRYVLLCVDNHATRKLANDFVTGADGGGGLEDIVLLSGGNDGVEEARAQGQLARRGTFGNVQLLVRRGHRNITPSLTEFHPEIADPADRLPSDLSCTELQQSVPQILFTNLQAASAMLSTLYLVLCGAADYVELVFDIAEARMLPIPLPNNQDLVG